MSFLTTGNQVVSFFHFVLFLSLLIISIKSAFTFSSFFSLQILSGQAVFGNTASQTQITWKGFFLLWIFELLIWILTFCTVTQCQSSIESSSRNMVGITFHRWQLNVLASGYTSDLRTGLQRIQRSLDRRKGKKRKAGILSISNEADHSFRRALVRAKTRHTLHTCVPGDEGETRARRPARKEEL